jgi:nicotinate phosphoribosyltransferase
MGTSSDRPYLDVIYKLCETMTAPGTYSPAMKLSTDKLTLPGRKQVYRFKDSNDNYIRDVITLDSETIPDAEPLLINVMHGGKLTYTLPSLNQIRTIASKNLSNLPEKYKTITNAETYPVELSQNLQTLSQTLREKITANEITHPNNV